MNKSNKDWKSIKLSMIPVKNKLEQYYEKGTEKIISKVSPSSIVDVSNAIKYIYDGNYVFGVLHMMYLIPYIGDGVIKPSINIISSKLKKYKNYE